MRLAILLGLWSIAFALDKNVMTDCGPIPVVIVFAFFIILDAVEVIKK